MKSQGVEYLNQDADPGQQAEYLLYYDELTGLYNRRFYKQAFEEQCRTAPQNATSLGLLLINLDFFAELNERYGHHQGAAVLASVAAIINEMVGTSGYPIRYAGDEFVVLLPETNRQQVLDLAQALVERVRDSQFKLLNRKQTVELTLSVGAAYFPGDVHDPSDLLDRADRALHIAKQGGRDRVVAYEGQSGQVLESGTLYRYFPCPLLVGREDLLVTLVEILSRPPPKERPWVILTGPSGSGKSRILEELMGRVDKQRHLLLRVNGRQHRADQPYGLVTDVLREYLAVQPQAREALTSVLRAGEVEAVSRLLPDLWGVARPTAAGQGAVTFGNLFHQLLLAIALSSGLTLLLDDLQWADADSLEVLSRLRHQQGCFVCAATDGPPPGLFEATVMRLEPLARGDRVAMLEAILPQSLGFAALVEVVCERSEGIPLRLEEMLKLLISRGCLRFDGTDLKLLDLPRADLPADTERLLDLRAEMLEPEIRQVMARASVLGPSFDFPSLMLLESRDEGYLRGILERARKAHFVYESWSGGSDTIRYVSTHMHQAFYRSLAADERCKLHLQMARMRERERAWEVDAGLGELLFHYECGGDEERTAHYRKALADLHRRPSEPGASGAAIEEPLPSESLDTAAQALLKLKLVLQNVRLYGCDHVRRNGGFDELLVSLQRLFEGSESIRVAEVDGRILVNGSLVPLASQPGSALVDGLRVHGLKALTFKRGLEAAELSAAMDLMRLGRQEVRQRGGMSRLLREVGVLHVGVNERVFMPPMEPMEEDIPQPRRPPPQSLEAEFMRSLQRNWSVLRQDLESSSRDRVQAACATYLELGEDSVEPLLAVIATSEDERARRMGVALLKKVTSQARALVVRHLFMASTARETARWLSVLADFTEPLQEKMEVWVSSADGEVRQAAIDLLARRDRLLLQEALLTAARHGAEEVQCDAVVALGKYRMVEAVAYLIDLVHPRTVLFDEPPERVQEQAALALGRMQDERALLVLARVTRHKAKLGIRPKPPRVRAAACMALLLLATPEDAGRVERVLRGAANDPSPGVRAAAAVAGEQLARKFEEGGGRIGEREPSLESLLDTFY